jgi:hypothetical protein
MPSWRVLSSFHVTDTRMTPTIAPIIHRVSRWAGVVTDPTHDGATFRIGDHELARLSGGVLTVATTPALRDQLLTDGFADRVSGHADRVGYRIRSSADVPGAIRLLRVAYLHRTVDLDPDTAMPDQLHRLGASTELVALLVTPPRDGDPERQAA